MKMQWQVSGGRDIYIRGVDCDCPLIPDNPALANVKRSMQIAGYADHNFFHNVVTTRHGCHKCGVNVTATWREDGTADVVRN